MAHSLEQLLRSNTAPEGPEISYAERAVQDKTAELVELDDAIQNLQSALWSLYNRRNRIEWELSQLQSVLSPIRRIPQDILGEIFSYLEPAFTHPGDSNEWARRVRVPWRLGLVCRAWRHLALSMSGLWNALECGRFARPWGRPALEHGAMHEHDDNEFRPVTPEEEQGYEIERALEPVKECLRRSKERGLFIRLRISGVKLHLARPLLDLLLTASHRWQEVIFVHALTEVQDYIRQHQSVHPFPRLQHIAYDMLLTRYRNPIAPTFQVDIPSTASALAALTIAGSEIPPLSSASEQAPFSWTCLRKYCEISCTVAVPTRVAMYAQLTSLVELRIESVSCGAIWPSSMYMISRDAIQLPSLHRATFIFRDRMSPMTLDMPELRELTVQGYSVGQSLSTCFPRQAPFLNFERKNFHKGDTETVLERYPELQDVSFSGPNYFDEACIERLIMSSDCLVPRLRTLSISCANFLEGLCKWKTLLAMVRSRFMPPAGTARTLQRLEFMDHASPNEWHVLKGLKVLSKQTGWDIRVKEVSASRATSGYRPNLDLFLRHHKATPCCSEMPKEPKTKRKAAEKADKADKEKGGRKKKDPNAPKRALSAYMFFSQDWRERIRAENPDANFGELGKLLGAKWKELDDEEKQPYNDQATKDKERAERERKEYEAKSAPASGDEEGGGDDDDE
ncbi:hypothetical protein MKEN_01133900 [Mycena kentingensis (nom. inval.)]|nr:hypothetical protein MKEN_01133900 [Mycena kentingensis (nom. inval.)]